MIAKLILLAIGLPVAAAVFGGSVAPYLDSLPWQVYIDIVVPAQHPGMAPTTSYCGGTIIGSRWILTAAHCVETSRTIDLTVVSGEYSLSSNDRTEQFHSVSKIYMNGFNRATGLNDIALLQLSYDIKFDQFRQPINLALPGEENTLTIFSRCQLSGWGSSYTGGPGKDVLEYLNVSPVDRQTCANSLHLESVALTGTPSSMAVDLQHICVGTTTTGSCKGDSGGPLTCLRTYVNPFNGYITSENVLLGVTSRGGLSCGGEPSVYTSVPWFYNWILSITNPPFQYARFG